MGGQQSAQRDPARTHGETKLGLLQWALKALSSLSTSSGGPGPSSSSAPASRTQPAQPVTRAAAEPFPPQPRPSTPPASPPRRPSLIGRDPPWGRGLQEVPSATSIASTASVSTWAAIASASTSASVSRSSSSALHASASTARLLHPPAATPFGGPHARPATPGPAEAAGPSSRGPAPASGFTGAQYRREDLWVPVNPPVLGIKLLAVRQLPYGHVGSSDVAWLRGGWDAADAARAIGAKRLPRVLGFDTEFDGGQLALLQLCAGDRALLVRVPPVRPTGGASGGVQVPGQARAAEQHPFACPPDVELLLVDALVPKAAAEAWQDALMVFAAFGVKLRGGLDLTVAVPPSHEEQTRGRKKLSLFAIFERFFPASTLAKDKTIDHSKWFAISLREQQLRYAALDAFVSYAAGVMVQRRDPDRLPPPVDLSVPAHWEVVLAAQWVCVYQFLEAQSPQRSRHDFHQATFEMSSDKGGKPELQLFVSMARFNTRLRRQMFVFIRVPNDKRPILGRCVEAKGKSARVAQLCWAGGRNVRLNEVSEVREIEMDDPNETPEEDAIKKLIARVLCGQASLKGHRLAKGIFGGGSLVMPYALGTQRAAQARAAVEAALSADAQVNGPQHTAVEEVLYGSSAVTLVQGPPGTGKTTVISRVVELWLQHVAPSAPTIGPQRRAEAMACVARSNVAARNIALALIKRGLGPSDFRLVVSQEFHFEWHEEQYRGALERVLIVSDELRNEDMPRMLEDVKVFVTTTSMLTGFNFQQAALHNKVLTRLLVDEASQIYAGDMVLPLHVFGEHLKSLALFGDDVQLPPYGSEWDGATQPSPFDHLTPPSDRAAARLRPQPNAFTLGPDLCAAGGGVRRIMLEVSYRLPPSLCAFISQRMYGGMLRSGRQPSAEPALTWVDVRGGEAESRGGTSLCNPKEAHGVLKVVRQSVLPTGRSWTVLTGYDLQRSVLDKLISSQPDLARHQEGGAHGGGGKQDCDRVYNIDTFQGREDCVVVVSCVKTGRSLGFMRDDRRVNVMLTRCTHRLVVVGSLATALSEPDTLLCRLATHCVGHGLVRAA